jgi:hypothetical protein
MKRTILGFIFAVSFAHADPDTAKQAGLAQVPPAVEAIPPSEITEQKTESTPADLPHSGQSMGGKMRIFKDAEGHTLLTTINGTLPQSDSFAQFTQEVELKPIYKKVRIPAKKVYQKGWCKIGEDYAPCYKYQKTRPARTTTVIARYQEIPVKR